MKFISIMMKARMMAFGVVVCATTMMWMSSADAIEKGAKAVAKGAKGAVEVRPPYLSYFNPADDGRGFVNAYLCAALSKASYSREGFKDFAEKGGAIRNEFHREPSTDTEWGILEMPNVVLLVFRGSELKPAMNDLSDWAHDSNAKLEGGDEWGGGKVHKGFAKGANSVLVKVSSTTALYAGVRKPVFVCGHSLGGALATLAAFRLSSKIGNVRGLYTYGSPRVGNKDFQKAFVAKRFVYGRWVNDRDAAPVLPPERLNFFHVEKMHRLKSDSGATMDSSKGYPLDLTQISDHYMDNYLKKLWGLLSADQKALLPRP
jgi:lipase (class 3)